MGENNTLTAPKGCWVKTDTTNILVTNEHKLFVEIFFGNMLFYTSTKFLLLQIFLFYQFSLKLVYIKPF